MATIFGPRTKYGCQIWSLGQFLGRTIFAMTRLRGNTQWLYRFSSNLSNYISFTPKHAEGLKQSKFRRHPTDPPIMGKLRYCQSNSPDLGGTVPVLVSRRTHNRELVEKSRKCMRPTSTRPAAPSVVTVLLYQLEYADAV